jgi:hypothetical protein
LPSIPPLFPPLSPFKIQIILLPFYEAIPKRKIKLRKFSTCGGLIDEIEQLERGRTI